MRVNRELSTQVREFVYFAFWYNRWVKESPVSLVFTLSRHTTEIERIIMATKPKNDKPAASKPAYESVRWVNRQLTEDEKRDHDSKTITPVTAFKELLSLTHTGYNVAIKWDAYSSCFQVTLVPYNPASANFGYGLSARASDPFRAITLLLYKHFEVLKEDWSSAYKPTANTYEG